jgi:hypothetical protein
MRPKNKERLKAGACSGCRRHQVSTIVKKLSLQQACAGASEIQETEYNDSKLLVHGENRDELIK